MVTHSRNPVGFEIRLDRGYVVLSQVALNEVIVFAVSESELDALIANLVAIRDSVQHG